MGSSVAASVGASEGSSVAASVGSSEGASVGASVAISVGCSVGSSVGAGTGPSVGSGALPPLNSFSTDARACPASSTPLSIASADWISASSASA